MKKRNEAESLQIESMTIKAPVGIVEQLKERAKSNERSLNKEVVWILRQALEVRKNNVTVNG